MPALRKLWRSLVLILLMLTGLILSLIFLRGTAPPGAFSSRVEQKWLAITAHALGVRTRVYGSPNSRKTLFVSNHISWLDILVLGCIVPVHFLSKHEVKTMPVVGTLATRAGTLYIHRGRHESASQASADITRVLKLKHNAVVFAEGTTTDGNIRKFHSRMIQSAVDAGAMVQPVAIFYPGKDKESGKVTVNPDALFTGNTTIGESFNLIARAPFIDVEVHFLEPVSAVNRTHIELTEYAFEQVVLCIETIRSKSAITENSPG